MNQKNQFFLLLLLSVGFFLTSCQKEQAKVTEITEQDIELKQQSADKAKILHFVDKLKNLKSPSDVGDREAPLAVDDLAFGSEAVLNLYYTRFEDRFKEMDFSETDVVVPVSNGVVNDSDLSTAYASIEQAVTNHLSAAPFADKKVGYVDVIVSEVTNNEATIRVKTAIGGVEIGPSDPSDPVAQDYFSDDWHCGKFKDHTNTIINAVGKCITSSQPDLDATKLLESTLNVNYRKDHPFPLIYHGVYGFQVDSESFIPLFNLSNNSEYYHDTYNGNLDDVCISENDMNNFYDVYESKIAERETTTYQLNNQNQFPTTYPGETGWKMKWFDLTLQRFSSSTPSETVLRHLADVTFMKQIIIYDDGGSGYASSTADALTWVKSLLD